MKTIALLSLTLAASISLPNDAAAQPDIGKVEYDQSCASCHGLDGKGKGPFAQALELSVPDVTTLAKRNGGVFPATRAYSVIDGREAVKAHGTRDMPIWGRHYSASAAPRYDDYAYNPEAAARARILFLIDYLHRLQVK